MNKSIMAVGAHADDVELHFGGTLFKYMDKGYAVVYVMATNNMSGPARVMIDGKLRHLPGRDPVETMAYRKREAREGAKLFNTEPIHLDHPQRHYAVPNSDGSATVVTVTYGTPVPPVVKAGEASILTAFNEAESVDRLKKLILERDPEVIFTHGYAETDPEHYCTLLLVSSAYWKAVEDGYGGHLLMGTRNFDTLGRFGCCWETWVSIDGYIDRRMAAVRKHVSQYPADFEYAATYWRQNAEKKGAACGVKAVESFNFVNHPDPDGVYAPDALIGELIRNRADKFPWGL